MKKYEYSVKKVTFVKINFVDAPKTKELEKDLNEMEEKGWRFAGFYNPSIAIFEKEEEIKINLVTAPTLNIRSKIQSKKKKRYKISR